MTESDGAVIQRVLDGDADGFRLLVERYSPAVFRLAYRMTGSREDADDVVQETLLRAYKSLARYDGRASFSTWLYRICANYSLDFLTAKKRQSAEVQFLAGDDGERRFEPVEEGAGPDRIAFSKQVREQVDKAMGCLTPQERAAFVMRHFEECPVEEIGEALGLAPSAARHSIFRAVQKLRKALAPLVKVTA